MSAEAPRHTADWQRAHSPRRRRRGKQPVPPLSPTVHRRQLGAELRRLREAAGLRIEEAAKALDTSQPRMSRIETGRGRYALKASDVRTLCTLYGLTDEGKVETMIGLLTISQQRGWWE